MAETLTALLFAHVLADYVFQTEWLVFNKRKGWPLLIHALIVLLASLAVTGHSAAPEIYVLAAVHLLVDLLKTFSGRSGFMAHITDQVAHIVTIFAVALYAPDLFAQGAWAQAPSWVLHVMALLGGAIYVIRAGGFAIGTLMAQFSSEFKANGLTDGGILIGQLERGLIFLMMSMNQPAAIGFLIAAKSVMRFETASKEQKAAEYVIIGTLASFGWAIAITIGITTLRSALPPLEITAAHP